MRDEAADRLVDVGRVAEGGVDLGRVHRPVGPIIEGPDAGADDDRVAGRLVDDDVVLAAGDGLLAAGEVRHLGDEVAHRAARDEEAGLLAEELGGAFLEGDRPSGRRRRRHRRPRRRPWPGAWPGEGWVTVSLRRSIGGIGRV